MASVPRILLVGQWTWPWYQEACARALESLGCVVERFKWFDYFYRWVDSSSYPVYHSRWAAVQNRLLAGPALARINRELIYTATRVGPDIIWLYGGTHIYPRTVRALRRRLKRARLVQYTNDNPFSSLATFGYWRHVVGAIPYFDLHFVYRTSNIEDFRRAGAREVELLRAYYVPDDDYEVALGIGDEPYRCDVVFAGHFEDDGRVEYLEDVARAGYRVNLFGGGWDRARRRILAESPLRPQLPVVGATYRKAICGASIALCFLSKINRDTYTRRNFQIPAMRRFMLSEYSDDLAGMFQEGIEAEFFRGREELVDKVRYYLRNERARDKIAQRGHECVVESGHDVLSRMRQFLNYSWG